MLMNKKYYILFLSCLFLFSCSDEGVNPIYGCTNEDACNYVSGANINDESCIYNSQECDCDTILENTCYCDDDGNILDNCGVCNNEFIYLYSDILNLLNLSTTDCTSCHSGTNPSHNLNLKLYDSDNNQVRGISDVLSDCSNIENSLILQKIDGGSMTEYASQELIDAIRVWISEGAPK